MTAEEILQRFRETWGPYGCHHHLATCPETYVMKFHMTGPDTFYSLVKCPHHRPIGYEVMPREEEDASDTSI